MTFRTLQITGGILFAAMITCCIVDNIQTKEEMVQQRAEHFTLLYSGWCKVYGVTNLSYSEWAALRDGGLLPKPTEPGSSGPGMVDIAIGTAIGRMIKP
jgi:hypothetical protein